MMRHYADFSELVGRTITEIFGCEKGSEEILFRTSDGMKWRMFHSQDCCETVDIEDIAGDINDLLDSPVLLAEEVSLDNQPAPDGSVPEYPESYTWTFYKIATIKGHVTLRWLGESNGYYSESVEFERVGGNSAH